MTASTTSVNRERHSALAPLRTPAFAAFWTASFVATLLNTVQAVGVAWLLISINDAPTIIAALQTASCLPIILLSFFAGALADSIDRRLVMLGAQIVLLASSALLAVAAIWGHVSVLLILVLATVNGAALAFYGPSAQAALGALVARDKMPAAVGLGSLSLNFSRTIGPAIGGLIVALAGAGPAILVGAIGAVVLCVVICLWKPSASAHALPPEPLLEGIRTGARYITLSPAIIDVLLRTGVFALCAGIILAFPPLVATALLGGGPGTLGLLLAAFGFGAIASAFVSARLRLFLEPNQIALVSGLGMVACLALIGANVHPALTTFAFAASGATWVAFLTPLAVSVQLNAPHWMAGRTAAAFQITLAGGLALGSLVWGALAEQVGVGGSLLCASGALAVLLFQTRSIPLVLGDELEWAPIDDGVLGLPQIPQSLHEGRITVALEYRVPPGEVEEFKAAMQTLRRIRLRDGARRWALLQDLEDGELWMERFEALNWTEHLRRQSRLTVADQALRENALRFSTAPVEPRRFVHHE
ncbi:MAG: hypothetical protein RIR33_414 [Pseudomonadota bacterium]